MGIEAMHHTGPRRGDGRAIDLLGRAAMLRWCCGLDWGLGSEVLPFTVKKSGVVAMGRSTWHRIRKVMSLSAIKTPSRLIEMGAVTAA